MFKVICKILLCALLLSFCVCKTNWINTSKEQRSKRCELGFAIADYAFGRYRLATDERRIGLALVSGSNLYTVIDGGDMPYTKNHLIEGRNTIFCREVKNCSLFIAWILELLQTVSKWLRTNVMYTLPNYPYPISPIRLLLPSQRLEESRHLHIWANFILSSN